MDVTPLVDRVSSGDRRALARVLSWVEDGSEERLREVIRLLHPRGGGAHRVGITGSPGVGKSTLTSALITRWRALGRTVAVLAVDPSSPFTGGALLGDRVRMQDHATDPGVYIRSMATRGHLGGLAASTAQAIRVLDAAGCDVVLVETVGVGQSEVDVASAADTTLVLLAPGMGDAVQAAKAGILEIADVFVVNKADRDGAHQVVRELRGMIALGERGPGDWRPPIVSTVAVKGEGVADVVAAIDQHRAWLERTGQLAERRHRRTVEEIAAIALTALRARFGSLQGDKRLEALADRVLLGDVDPYSAADELVAQLSS